MPTIYNLSPLIFKKNSNYELISNWTISGTNYGMEIELFLKMIVSLYDIEYENYRKYAKKSLLIDDSIYSLLTRNEFLNKIKLIEKNAKEGDIIKIGLNHEGQYYIYNENNQLLVKKFIGEHELYYPSNILQYIRNNNIESYDNLITSYNVREILESENNINLNGILLESCFYDIYYKTISKFEYDYYIKNDKDYEQLFDSNDYNYYIKCDGKYVYVNMNNIESDKYYIMKINDKESKIQYNLLSEKIIESNQY